MTQRVMKTLTGMNQLEKQGVAFDEKPILETVIMGHQQLIDVINKKNAIYAKPDFNDEDGIEVSKLEEKFLKIL